MTNPRVYTKSGELDLDATRELRNRNPLSIEEVDGMLKEADKIPNEYFKLRAKAVVALGKIFGKRRSEIASLTLEDLKVEDDRLLVTFTLCKKHKKGLFQYLNFLKKNDPSALDKPLSQLESDWKLWTQTKEGCRVREEKRTKAITIADKYAVHIIAYADYLKARYPEVKHLFPSGRDVFGQYVIDDKKHLTGRQILRLIKPLNPSAWMHLFRETKGAEVARDFGRTLTAVFEVKETLDLEGEQTALKYVRRYAIQEMRSKR